MKDKRQGNDLKVAWSIFMQDGEPFRLDGKDVSLYLKNMFGRKELSDFVTTGNIIQWTFYGKDQKNSGKYSLELVINEGEKGMITTDKCDFVNLVSCSCKLQGGEDAPNVETESIELTSTLEYVAGGGEYDDTALWGALENKVDKVEGLGLSEENYTSEDKEKLAGLENYDDSGIKEELAKKVESEVVVDTESTEDFEFGYDDTKIRQEIAELSAKVENINPTQMVSVTYAELVALRDNGELIAGMQYRITDYVTTTAQENTKSAGHQFDVIVTADNKNTLNEVARACLHEGDTYFSEAGANLAAWQIWYSLDNNAERFAWADTENGKGVIYRMIDEWNNDVPYDFKNIKFKRYILNADNAFATDIAKGGELEIVKAKLQEMSHKIHTNVWYYGEYISDVYPEANPDARYVPFGDIDYNNEGPQVLCEIDDNNSEWFYTFHNENEDASLLKPNVDENVGVYENTIKDSCYVFFVEEGTGSYYPTKINAQSLNNIVFVGNDCNSNSFGNDCNSNSFGNYCNSNSFGSGCNSNSFGNYCNYNSFGNSSQSNKLKAYYRYITFEEGVQYVTLLNETEGDYENQVQNYRVANGTHGEDGNPLIVDVTRNMGCETFIGMDSNDELKVFCLADLLNL